MRTVRHPRHRTKRMGRCTVADIELMTTAQVLEFLQIGRTKLWGLVRAGAISAYRIGNGPNGSLRYRHEEIMDWLEKQRVSNGRMSPQNTEQVARASDRDI
jgi:predicted DNA-binding transcriptional regulator AlpA